MVRYYTADIHLGNSRMLEVELRGRYTLDVYEDSYIGAWNQQVTQEDTVEVVGDMFHYPDIKYIKKVLDKLNGNINYTLGNKDDYGIWKQLLDEGYIKELNTLGKSIMLSDSVMAHLTHYPLSLGPMPNIINIHGHIHSRPSQFPNQFNVGVPSPHLSYKPDFYMPTDKDILDLLRDNLPIITSWWENFDGHIYSALPAEKQSGIMLEGISFPNKP